MEGINSNNLPPPDNYGSNRNFTLPPNATISLLRLNAKAQPRYHPTETLCRSNLFSKAPKFVGFYSSFFGSGTPT